MGPCSNQNSTALEGPGTGAHCLAHLLGWVRLLGAGLAAHVILLAPPLSQAAQVTEHQGCLHTAKTQELSLGLLQISSKCSPANTYPRLYVFLPLSLCIFPKCQNGEDN